MKIMIAAILVAMGIFVPEFSFAQSSRSDITICNEVKDSIIVRYNRSDFKGIYRLADSSFSKTVTESQLTDFLAGNFSSGRIVKTSLQKDSITGREYLLEGQARNMILVLDVSPEKKFTTFGFKNIQAKLLPMGRNVQNNNEMTSKLDRVIDSIAKEYFRFPYAASLSIGIIKNGKRFNYHYGETEKGTGKLPDLKTGYQIASVTKTFTATLLAQAVLEHKVKLTDDIRKYLPGSYPNLEYLGQPITLQDLANHTSGLPTIPPNLEKQANFDPVNSFTNYTRTMFYEALQRLKINTAPGSKFDYSNMGMSLVGLILENVYGTSYEHLVKKYITGPMKMPDTKIALSGADKKQMALLYANNGNVLPFWNMGICAGAGGITSTTADMLNYLDSQIKEENAAIKLTHQPTANSTGLGWGVRTVNGIRDLQHNGGAPGSRSNITFYPELKSGCVILINNDSDTNIMNNLVIAVQKAVKNF